MRILIVSIFLLFAATLARGQVATPSLVPGAFTGENPAVIKWGAPSRIGASTIQGPRMQDGTPGWTYVSGAGGGFRLVGETVALGGQSVHLDTQPPALHEMSDAFNISLAFQSGTSLSLGFGYDGFAREDSVQKISGKVSSLGVSLRMGERLFFGAVSGQESARIETLASPTTPTHTQRDVTKVAAAVRRAGTVLVHAEVFGIEMGNYYGMITGAEKTEGGTLEFCFGPVLMAYSERTTRIGGIPNKKVSTQSADIGWAPRTGLSAVLHGEERVTSTDATPPTTGRDQLFAFALTLSW